MELTDILTSEEIEKYHEEWVSFSGKYKPETPHNVHSGLPIIGQVFQYEDFPIFRAHIFKRKLQKAFDPYFESKDGYLHQYFHTTHYFIPIEQIYHVAMSRLIPNYSRFITLDRFDSKKPAKMVGRIDFEKTRASVELIPKVTLGKGKFVGRGSATFYNDKTNEPLQIWYLEAIGTLRRYIQNIERVKQGDVEAVEGLVREIETLSRKRHSKLISPRNFPSEDRLIEKLRTGKIPEQELHDYFSFWERD